jgi:hypothetical protein
MKEATTTFYDLYLPLTTATKQRQMLALMQWWRDKHTQDINWRL